MSRRPPVHVNIAAITSCSLARTNLGVTSWCATRLPIWLINFRERGYAPRKVGHDSWESRCPGHRSSDHALSITRNEFNHVVLERRSAENCQPIRIIRAIGFTNDHVYAETPDWVISRLSRVEIHREESKITDVPDDHGHGLASVELASGSGEAPALVEGNAEADVEFARSEGTGDAHLYLSCAVAESGLKESALSPGGILKRDHCGTIGNSSPLTGSGSAPRLPSGKDRRRNACPCYSVISATSPRPSCRRC
jgi:hypothetical protein